MAISSRVVKITAKTTLKNNYLSCVFSGLILIFTFFVGVYVLGNIGLMGKEWITGVLFALYNFFIVLPICLGVLRFFWRNMFSVNDHPVSVFYYFSNSKLYKKCIKMNFLLLLKAIIPSLILAIPVVALWLLTKGLIFEWMNISIPLWTANLTYIYIFVKNLAIIILLIYMFKYYLTPLFIISDENMEVDEAMHMSTVISKKSSLDFSYLLFSFCGWIIISILVLPLVFTLPYLFSAYTVHFRFVVAEYNKHANQSKNSQYPYFTEGV